MCMDYVSTLTRCDGMDGQTEERAERQTPNSVTKYPPSMWGRVKKKGILTSTYPSKLDNFPPPSELDNPRSKLDNSPLL